MSAALLAKVHTIRLAGLTAVKTGSVPGKFKFASYADVWTALHPSLQVHDLSVGFSGSTISIAGALEIMRLTLEVTDGETQMEKQFEILLPECIRNSSGGAVTNSSQRSGGGATYARRTALILFFNIATGDDAEVERMQPGNMERARGATVSDAAPWSALLDGGWCDAPAGDGKRTLGDLNNAQRKALWEKDPASKPLMAWVGDLITNMLGDAGYSWETFRQWANAGLPEVMEQCTPGLLKIAAEKAKQIPDQ